MSPVMSAEGLVSATATQSQEGMRAGLTLLDPSQARASCVTLPARLVVRRLAVPVTCRVHVVLRAVKPGVCGLPGEHRALRAVLSCASKRGRQPFEAVTQKRLAEPFVEDGEDRNCSHRESLGSLGNSMVLYVGRAYTSMFRSPRTSVRRMHLSQAHRG